MIKISHSFPRNAISNFGNWKRCREVHVKQSMHHVQGSRWTRTSFRLAQSCLNETLIRIAHPMKVNEAPKNNLGPPYTIPMEMGIIPCITAENPRPQIENGGSLKIQLPSSPSRTTSTMCAQKQISVEQKSSFTSSTSSS